MDTKLIPEKLDELHSALVAKLGGQPYISTMMMVRGDFSVALYDRHEVSTIPIKHVSAVTPDECFAKAFHFVANLPDPDFKAQHDWHKKLLGVIDEGHELALSDELLDPLRDVSLAMTENLLAAPVGD
jgi:hypothetical protein